MTRKRTKKENSKISVIERWDKPFEYFGFLNLVLMAFYYGSLWFSATPLDAYKVFKFSLLMAFEFIMVHSGVFMVALAVMLQTAVIKVQKMKEFEYNGTYADCYVLNDGRTEKFIFEFLNHFIPERKESASEYEFPQYEDDSQFIFQNDHQIIEFLLQKTNVEYSLYWNNKRNEDLKGAMVFFTLDNKIIFGLFCNTLKGDTKIEDEYFQKLKLFTQSNYGYISYEQIPEMDTNTFIELSIKSL